VQQFARFVREKGMGIVMIEPPTPDRQSPWTGADAVYAATYRDLLRVAYVLTGSGSTAEDVVHDVVCSVFPRLHQLDNPGAYLRVAVVNRCRSLHRRSVRAPQPELRQDDQLDPGLTELRDELGRLPARQRSAIVLRYLCDLSDREIADALGCREGTVRSLLHRGLADLRRTLTKVQ
jgi:RNA polymerase sigma factor (sigma-70 family)